MRRLGLAVTTIVGLLLTRSCKADLSFTKVKIENSGYTGLVIAIHPDIDEDEGLIEAIKETWTEASKNLYTATGSLSYFKEITILVPQTWNALASIAGNVNYDQADVIIAPPNPSHGNEPYTVQHDGCGKPGIHTHFTPKYLLDDRYVQNYGARGKVVVHEWAHYRWGVFDETSQDEPFYWDPEYGPENGPVATKCPRDLMGSIRNIESDGAEEVCTLMDFEQGSSHPEYCVFFPHEDQYHDINVSLMSHQYLDYVTTFCRDIDENNKDTHNVHNIYAPNEQNRLCGMRSTWTVIQQSPDYLEWNGNDITDISQTKPVFNVVTPQAQRFVLILDDSRSMDGWRTDALKAAASIFITVTAPNNSYVGIVIFGSSSYTYIESNLILLNSPDVREALANKLNKLRANSGSTSIGSGIQNGVAVLEAHGDPAAGHLVVITDGQENDAPYVFEIRDDILRKGIIIDTVFIEIESNQDLKELTEDSGGVWYFAETPTDLQEIFNQISVSESNDDNSYQIHSSAFTISLGESFTSSVYIDTTIGLSTTFTFFWTTNTLPPAIFISSPTGCSYTNDYLPDHLVCEDGISGIHVINTAFRTIQFIIPGVAEVGKWTYNVQGNYNVGDMTSLVTSMAANNTIKPIIIESGMSDTEVQDGSAAIVYAKVTQGYNPILGASVVATVTGPGREPKLMELYDNGAGSDIRKDDGIYSRYFTEYTGPGRYSVAVKVTNGSPTEARTKQGRGSTVNMNPSGAVSNEENKSTISGIQSQDLGDFSRVVSSGGFDYDGTVDTSSGSTIPDTFPPGQITDVWIRQKDLEDYRQGVIIEFTATGDDLDTGAANGYDIRYTFDDPTSFLRNFDNCSKVIQDDLTKGNLSDPAPAGHLEELIIKTPALPVHEDGTVYSNSRLAFSIKAYDSALNYGEPSNTAVINFFIEPVIVPTVAATTIPVSEVTTELVTDKICPIAEDPDVHFYKVLSASLGAIAAIFFIAAAVIVSIWLYRRKRANNCERFNSEEEVNGTGNIYENFPV